jgi:hypothetical protein
MGLWVAMIGLGLGACFSLSLTLTLEHLRTPAEAGSLAAFVQGMGFIVTGIVPYITGWLRDVSGDFQASWTLLTCTVLAMLLVTARFARVAMPGPSPGRQARRHRSTEALQGIADPVQRRVDIQQFDGAEAQQQPRAYRGLAEERRQRIEPHLDLARQVDQQLHIDPRLGQGAQVEAGTGRHGLNQGARSPPRRARIRSRRAL